jgi:hypothetical protein
MIIRGCSKYILTIRKSKIINKSATLDKIFLMSSTKSSIGNLVISSENLKSQNKHNQSLIICFILSFS